MNKSQNSAYTVVELIIAVGLIATMGFLIYVGIHFLIKIW